MTAVRRLLRRMLRDTPADELARLIEDGCKYNNRWHSVASSEPWERTVAEYILARIAK
jgi:hypothetical protein